jgi:LDH2 family malate/lactate/ureidoglycolate dehydrogenase
METYVKHLKDCRLQPGCSAILMPGEIELSRRKEREAAGIVIPDETWRQLSELGTKLGVATA